MRHESPGTMDAFGHPAAPGWVQNSENRKECLKKWGSNSSGCGGKGTCLNTAVYHDRGLAHYLTDGQGSLCREVIVV